MIDQTQLRQLVMNLVGNAIDATRNHGREVVISTAIEFCDEQFVRKHGTNRSGQFVVISVADDGHGMDKHTLAQAFEPFFTTKEPGKGTGLGLSMCQSIVSRSGGFVTVESQLGRGTTCRAYLPLGERRLAEDSVRAKPLDPSAPAVSEAHVLLVEDDPDIRQLMQVMLEELSLSVRAVGNAEAAARSLATERIDLLITDGNLPDGSGRVLARSARTARPSLRVLLVSGSPDESNEFDATLHKPFTIEALRIAVTSLLPARSVGRQASVDESGKG